jgi:arginyl-tRNA synthetase
MNIPKFKLYTKDESELMLKEHVAKILKFYLKDVEVEKYLEIPPQPDLGDLAFTCFELAKVEKRNPRDIAADIVDGIKLPKGSLIEKVEVKGGYVNFFFNWRKISEIALKEVLDKKEKYGKPDKVEKKKIMVEHTSTNPNKALHIGHTRNSCLGDSLARILGFCGHDIVVANYIDDSGAQVADVIVGFKFLNIPMETTMKFDQYCGDEVYVKVNKLYETNQDLMEKKKFVIQKIEEGKNEIAEFSSEIVNKILLEQLKTCWRINISYDLLNMETDLLHFKLWEKAFETLKEKGFAYLATDGERADCWLLKLSDLPEFKGMENPDTTLVRSDGTVVYVGKDISYAMWKHGLLKEDFKYDKFVTQPNKKTLWATTSKKGVSKHPIFKDVDISINVIDVRQSHYQNAVMAALKLISGKTKNYFHYAYEVVSLSTKTAQQMGIAIEEDKEFVHMAGRKGWFVNTDVTLDALFKKTLEETKKRNPTMNEKELKEIAEKIAISTLRYELTKISPEKIIVFDLDDALKLEGNTGPYLQYAHTRCCGILEKAGKWKPGFSAEKISEQEKELMKTLMNFPEIVENAAKDLKPHYICNYAYELATILDKFYELCPVLKAETEQQKNFRLSLVQATKIVLSNALNLVGMEALEKM